MTRESAVSALMVVAMAATLSGQAPAKRFLTAPLTIEDQGSFFIGGTQKITDYAGVPPVPATGAVAAPVVPHHVTIGQMYVQFQIPARKYGGWPVIMVHGSSHTAACLESTPDGREGWYPYFVRKGVPSYIVDQSGRGRSGFDESVIHEGEARIGGGDSKAGMELIPGFARIANDAAWNNWFGHLVPADSTIRTGRLIPHGDPADPNPNPDRFQHVMPAFPLEAINEYYKQLVPNAEATLPGSTLCVGCLDIREWSRVNRAFCELLHRTRSLERTSGGAERYAPTTFALSA